MAYPSVVLDCPSCGAQLQHHVGPPQDTPWLCRACGRGWWNAELTPKAREAWRPHEKDHGGVDVDTHLAIIEERHREHADAVGRRTSCREDHLPFLTAAQLDALVAFLGPYAAFHPGAGSLLGRVREARKNVNEQVG